MADGTKTTSDHQGLDKPQAAGQAQRAIDPDGPEKTQTGQSAQLAVNPKDPEKTLAGEAAKQAAQAAARDKAQATGSPPPPIEAMAPGERHQPPDDPEAPRAALAISPHCLAEASQGVGDISELLAKKERIKLKIPNEEIYNRYYTDLWQFISDNKSVDMINESENALITIISENEPAIASLLSTQFSILDFHLLNNNYSLEERELYLKAFLEIYLRVLDFSILNIEKNDYNNSIPIRLTNNQYIIINIKVVNFETDAPLDHKIRLIDKKLVEGLAHVREMLMASPFKESTEKVIGLVLVVDEHGRVTAEFLKR